MKKVVVTQSNYIPWRGYFMNIKESDHLVLLDDVQFTRRDWRNRNQILTPQGKKWLTVPVNSKGQFGMHKICHTEINDPTWMNSHRSIIDQMYRKAPYYKQVMPFLNQLYDDVIGEKSLSMVNRHFLESICQYAHVDIDITWSTDHFDLRTLEEFDSTERLLNLCKAVKATSYISGPAAQAYMDVELFAQEGIEIIWADYSPLQPYPQLYEGFDGAVSIIDTLMMINSLGLKE
ncbi:WbqC family protein [Temperatibacter marinus]|uniref:WbqC family protein n=1 Tax=Temperatibacter marinus TaxID=1456591 RepID=A0AA52EGF3_9PROT|nr:WbqC family protein [Temperatibacter marinus]WND03208.1 WbqC family protein [Temperatibacter marinus]